MDTITPWPIQATIDDGNGEGFIRIAGNEWTHEDDALQDYHAMIAARTSVCMAQFIYARAADDTDDGSREDWLYAAHGWTHDGDECIVLHDRDGDPVVVVIDGEAHAIAALDAAVNDARDECERLRYEAQESSYYSNAGPYRYHGVRRADF